MRRILALASVIAVAASFAPHGAFAASGTKNITLSPSSTALTVEPAVTANRNLTIINDGDTPYSVSLSVAPYHVQGEDYDPAFTRLPGTTDTTKWVTLSQTKLSLQAHETATVPYTVTVPTATAPGGYYAVLFAQTEGAPGGVSAQNRVGNILYVTVDGTVTQSGNAVNADAPAFTFGTGVTLGERVTNSGGVHFQTDARFKVSGLFGGTPLDKTNTLYVLPQTTRHITQTFEPSGIGGIYKVSRSATVPGSTKTLPDTWIVVVKPQIIPLLIFVLLTIIGFFILLARTKKSPKTRK